MRYKIEHRTGQDRLPFFFLRKPTMVEPARCFFFWGVKITSEVIHPKNRNAAQVASSKILPQHIFVLIYHRLYYTFFLGLVLFCYYFSAFSLTCLHP